LEGVTTTGKAKARDPGAANARAVRRQLDACRGALEQLAASRGVSLADATVQARDGALTLHIILDKSGGVTLDDIEAFHRAALPVVEPVDYDFMEVESPGLDRALTKDADYAAALGETLDVRLYRPDGARPVGADGVAGSANPKGPKAYIGTLVAFDAGTLTLGTGTGPVAIERSAVALAKRHVDVEAALAGAVFEEESEESEASEEPKVSEQLEQLQESEAPGSGGD